MGQVLIKNISEGLIEAYKVKARLQGTSQALRGVLERNAPFTPAERAALARQYVTELSEPLPPLTKDEDPRGPFVTEQAVVVDSCHHCYVHRNGGW